jgi:hypothetical protein
MRLVIAFVLAGAATLQAQAPNFAGTWQLDEARSQIVATAGITGLIPAGAPKTLHITQPANGTVVIESQINEAHVRIYRPGRETSTPAGQGGAVTMTSKWDGRALASEGAMMAPNGDTTSVSEKLSVSADGKTLTMAVTTATAAGKASSTLTYSKITDVGPCETWPTPCKRPKGLSAALVVRLLDRDELGLAHHGWKILPLPLHWRIFGSEVLQLHRLVTLRGLIERAHDPHVPAAFFR